MSLADAQPNRRSQINSLDGLRGLAALLVLLSHASGQRLYLFPGFDLLGTGKSGVYLFFILSAFLLTLPFLEENRFIDRRAFLLNYAVRRFLRIYPLYTLYLLTGWLTTLYLWRWQHLPQPVGQPLTLSSLDFFRQLTLQQGLGVTWSILVEFRYYFVLPFVALAYALVFKNKLLPCVLLTAALIFVSRAVWPESELQGNDPCLGFYLPVFLVGSLLAPLHIHWRKHGWHEQAHLQSLVEGAGMLALASLACLVPALYHWLGLTASAAEINHRVLVFGLLWAVVLFACVNGRGYLRWLFENPVLRFLGWISFSVYLWHISILFAVQAHAGNAFLKDWVILVLTVAAATATYYLVERPAMRIRVPFRSAVRHPQAQSTAA